MANAIKLNNIPDYVNETREELIAKTVLGGNSQGMFNLMTGVTGPTDLHLLATDVTLQDGTTCGFTPAGDQTISKRTLTPAVLKVNMEYCEKVFLNTYASHNLKLAAGKEVLPYEQKFIGEVVANVNDAVEKMIYNGDSDNTAECDGLIKILKADGAIEVDRKTTVYETLKEVYASMPEEVIVKNDAVILVSPSDFRAFVQEIVAGNMFHYDANDNAGSYYLPGTNVKVISVNGLAGTDTIIAGALSNIFVGVDLANDKEVFDFWWSVDDRVWKLAIEFAIGVQVAYPSEIVIAYDKD